MAKRFGDGSSYIQSKSVKPDNESSSLDSSASDVNSQSSKSVKSKKSKKIKKIKKPVNKKKRIGVSIMMFLILTTLGLFGAFLYIYYEDWQVEHKWDKVSTLASNGFDDSLTKDSDESADDKNAMGRNILFDDLWKVNKDIIAWIYIPHTNIDYPILQEQKAGQYYYLHRDVYKNRDSNGSILTPKIAHNEEDMHFLVFGHHMNSGAMFGNLRDEFYSKSGYNKHKYVYIYWPDKTEKWDIWSVYDTDVNDMIYDVPYERGSKAYTKLIKHIDGRKNYSTDRKLKNITNLDHTMTLSTCRGAAGGDLRFTVSCTINKTVWLNDKAKDKYRNSEMEKNNKLLATPTPEPVKPQIPASTPATTVAPQPTEKPVARSSTGRASVRDDGDGVVIG